LFSIPNMTRLHLAIFLTAALAPLAAQSVAPILPGQENRPWIGPDFWQIRWKTGSWKTAAPATPTPAATAISPCSPEKSSLHPARFFWRQTLRVAALSCNGSMGFPHTPLVRNVSDQNPDLIAFLGDQLYEAVGGYGVFFGPADNTLYDDRVTLCYLRKYYMHGWSWCPLLSRIPSVTIPDDHNVFHGNYWGASGKLADRSVDSSATAQDSGGYKLSAGTVNAVHLTQTGNLPGPSDAELSLNDISVYFTRWNYVGMDMAILSDRQFKSAPKALLPEAKIVNEWPQNRAFQFPNLQDARVFDVEGASLLGPRQEKFLAVWAVSPAPGSRWRLVFSQTPFASAHSVPADAFSDNVVPGLPVLKPGDYPPNDTIKVDFDGNGWPQSRRDFAVREITRAGALHIAGDQHLGKKPYPGWPITIDPATHKRIN
jgi:hypothetical protein